LLLLVLLPPVAVAGGLLLLFELLLSPPDTTSSSSGVSSRILLMAFPFDWVFSGYRSSETVGYLGPPLVRVAVAGCVRRVASRKRSGGRFNCFRLKLGQVPAPSAPLGFYPLPLCLPNALGINIRLPQQERDDDWGGPCYDPLIGISVEGRCVRDIKRVGAAAGSPLGRSRPLISG